MQTHEDCLTHLYIDGNFFECFPVLEIQTLNYLIKKSFGLLKVSIFIGHEWSNSQSSYHNLKQTLVMSKFNLS